MLKPVIKWIIPVLFIAVSCINPANDRIRIHGTLPDAKGQTLVLQELEVTGIVSLDSATIGQSGEFSFVRPTGEAGFWLLKAPTGRIMVFLLHPGEEAVLSGRYDGFPANARLTGPPGAVLLNDFYVSTRVRERQVDSLETLLLAGEDSTDYYRLTVRADSLFRIIWEEQRDFERDFIDRHSASLGSLAVLNYAFGRTPVLNPDSDFVYYRKVDSALQISYPGNKHVLFHHQRMEGLKAGKR